MHTFIKTTLIKCVAAGLMMGILSLLLAACFQEEVIPVTIQVTYQAKNDDYSIPVAITFDNRTMGAENYQWTFEGGEPAVSYERNPGTVLYAKEGIYKVKLEAWSEDDRQSKEITLQLLGTVTVDFETTIAANNISPVMVAVTNKTEGGTAYHWQFPGGEPESFSGYAPPAVLYTTPGEHTITLVVENGAERNTLTRVISVLPSLAVDFSIEPSFEDEDYEAPLHATLVNSTVSGLAWQWSSSAGGEIAGSTSRQPSVFFSAPGTYTVTLTATNDKETKHITREITVKPNSGLRTLTGIKLGINTAHGSIGSYYSTTLRRVIRKDDPDSLGKHIDLAFFGLNAGFTYNRFVSPDSVQHYTFDPVLPAQTTHFINLQEVCNCGVNFTEADFNQMITDQPLKDMTVRSTAAGVGPFDNTLVPRIVLFATADNRKGAIRIKEFHSDGLQSYIVVDIKVQKQ